MNGDTQWNRGLKASLQAMDGTLDQKLPACPTCFEWQLRAELREEWVELERAAAVVEVPKHVLLAAHAAGKLKMNGLGLVACSVPHFVCMACGADFDASYGPDDQDQKGN